MDPAKFEEYAEIQGWSPQTKRQYKLTAKRIEPYWENEQITQNTINRFLRKISRNKSYGNPYYLSFVRRYLDCYRMEMQAAGIRIQLPRIRRKKTVKQEYKFLTIKQISFLLKNITNRQIKLMIRIYFETGLRCDELIRVQRKDIQLEERRIKGIGKRDVIFNEPFSHTTKKWLQIWFTKCKDPNHPFIFYTRHNNPVRQQRWACWYYIKKECAKAGIPNVHPHRLRHSLGYFLTTQGWTLTQIKTKLRHQDISTTQIYSVSTKEEVDEKMNELLQETTP